MGEIKSTLDLVMEKTKHLSLSSEEKQAQTRKEVKSRINGMLQKYQDGLLSLAQLQRDYEGFKAEYNLPDNAALAGQVINRLDPDLDNRTLFEVLGHCCQLEYVGLEDVINEYQAGYKSAAQSRMETLKEGLAKDYSISGSAVVPNLESDEQWRQEAQAMISAVEEKLNQEKDRLVGS